jgi:hypothetical protein
MKKSVVLIVGLLFLASFLTFHFFRNTKPLRNENIADSKINSASSTQTDFDKTNQLSLSSITTNTDATSRDILERYRQGLISKEQAVQETLLEENKKSLDIYGKVVDQYGNPVAGARVRGGIGFNVSFVKSGGEYRYTETDFDGRFQFLGIHGVGIGIWPQKEGYFYNLKQPSQRPDNYQPDPNNPVVFKMWKLRGAEPLVSSSIDAKIPHDGTSVNFDMATGKESADGNLRISLVRSPSEVRRSGHTFDWALKIEMLQGGLVAENDAYPYWAPDSGYMSTFEISMSSNNPTWFSKLAQSFYIKNAQGQYGRMQAIVYSALTPARAKIDFTVNPSGSQNLEPDIESILK